MSGDDRRGVGDALLVTAGRPEGEIERGDQGEGREWHRTHGSTPVFLYACFVLMTTACPVRGFADAVLATFGVYYWSVT
ncbi:hypothetical protein [Actinoplanes sp. NPDC051411]|uniref:hypothetical protein n=1 Tax=Actinoplanes sp. NPDC051411 TaxID=3155522 RepID=UPI003429E166